MGVSTSLQPYVPSTRLTQVSCILQTFMSSASYGDVHPLPVDKGLELMLQETPSSSTRKNTVPVCLHSWIILLPTLYA